ncbi:MAG: adenylyl-sulfate kinase [Phycisphaera sp.]|nr:adenylyl-sulfate kinase [Phycisphaera sp.]
MTTSRADGPDEQPGFAVWLTGLPASGKSTIAEALYALLDEHSVEVEVLESDTLRRHITPDPTFDEHERDMFYAAIAHMSKLLTDHGVSVIIAATGNRRRYRDQARGQIARFVEVHVDCPMEVCVERDPKGLYAAAGHGDNDHVPGAGAPYEAPTEPELTVRGDRQDPAESARQIFAELERHGWINGDGDADTDERDEDS